MLKINVIKGDLMSYIKHSTINLLIMINIIAFCNYSFSYDEPLSTTTTSITFLDNADEQSVDELPENYRLHFNSDFNIPADKESFSFKFELNNIYNENYESPDISGNSPLIATCKVSLRKKSPDVRVIKRGAISNIKYASKGGGYSIELNIGGETLSEIECFLRKENSILNDINHLTIGSLKAVLAKLGMSLLPPPRGSTQEVNP